MRKIKKAAALSLAAAGLVIAGAGVANASSQADAVVTNSPGVLSGNNIQIPIHAPINICGNTISVIGLLNPAFGNTCINSEG